jgi:N-acyl-D-amino-acid deacylase
LAVTAARDAGLGEQAPILKSQMKFTDDFFQKRRESLARGEPTGGRAMTVAYGLWTYDIAGEAPSPVTDALVANLIALQEPEGHWRLSSQRPPMAETPVPITALAAYEIDKYARGENVQSGKRAIERAQRWLSSAPLKANEDYVFRLWGLHWLGGSPEEVDRARQALLAQQRPDGGWGQLPRMESDAYATGEALLVLSDAGVPIESRAWQRGIRFLLDSQHLDGSWHVATRAKPVQVYFDNGDPYGKDQFISIPATAWATAALARGLTARGK